MTDSAATFQLPDLPSLVRSFELRANKNCKWVSDASINQLVSPGNFSIQRSELERLDAGLLASVCFPTCDGPQLRLAADFCTLWMLELGRQMNGKGHGWNVDGEPPIDDIELLKAHDLLKLVYPGIKMVADKQPPSWKTHFLEAARCYRSANLNNALENHRHLTLKDYTSELRDRSGVRLLLELIEPSEGLDIVPDTDTTRALRNVTVDIISWCLDLASYNNTQSHVFPTTAQNLIVTMMETAHLPLQAATYEVGDMIKDALNRFLELENQLHTSLATNPISDEKRSWGWWFKSQSSTEPQDPMTHDRAKNDLRLWVAGLRDCIVGTVHWLYETDMFFGDSGMHVREYGWIFLKPSQADSESGDLP